MDSSPVKNTHGLPRLNLPAADFRVRREADGGLRIWDALRRKWLVLTPEEWVRQHLLRMLTGRMGVPPAAISQECPVCIEGMPQRADVVVFAGDGKPLLLAECKAPDAGADPAAYAQAVRYNTVLGARYILVTDGMKHFAYEYAPDGTYTSLERLPDLSGAFIR